MDLPTFGVVEERGGSRGRAERDVSRGAYQEESADGHLDGTKPDSARQMGPGHTTSTLQLLQRLTGLILRKKEAVPSLSNSRKSFFENPAKTTNLQSVGPQPGTLPSTAYEMLLDLKGTVREDAPAVEEAELELMLSTLVYALRSHGLGQRAGRLEVLHEDLKATAGLTEATSLMHLLLLLAGTDCGTKSDRDAAQGLTGASEIDGMQFNADWILRPRLSPLDVTDAKSVNSVFRERPREQEWLEYEGDLERQRKLTLFGGLGTTMLPEGSATLDLNLSIPRLPSLDTEEAVAEYTSGMLGLSQKPKAAPQLPPKPQAPIVPKKNICTPFALETESMLLQNAVRESSVQARNCPSAAVIQLSEEGKRYAKPVRYWEDLPGGPKSLGNETLMCESGTDKFCETYQAHFEHLFMDMGVETKEVDLVCDVCSCLQGVNSASFRFHAEACIFQQVVPDIRLKYCGMVSLQSLIQKVLKHGTLMRRLEMFCDYFTSMVNDPGLVRQAFASELFKLLSEVRSFIIVTVDELMEAAAKSDHEPHLLMELLLKCDSVFERINFLAGICGMHDHTEDYQGILDRFPRGARLLSFLYERTREEAVPAYEQVYTRLFTQSVEPYLEFLRSWIYEAICDDPYDEFMVEVKASLPQMDDNYWTDTFQERAAEHVPSFIRSVSPQMFQCGKQLHVLKQYVKRHYLFLGSKVDLRIAFDIEGIKALELRRSQRFKEHNALQAVENEIADQKMQIDADAAALSHAAEVRAVVAREEELVAKDKELERQRKKDILQSLKDQMAENEARREAEREAALQDDIVLLKKQQQIAQLEKDREEELIQKAKRKLLKEYMLKDEELNKRIKALRIEQEQLASKGMEKSVGDSSRDDGEQLDEGEKVKRLLLDTNEEIETLRANVEKLKAEVAEGQKGLKEREAAAKLSIGGDDHEGKSGRKQWGEVVVPIVQVQEDHTEDKSEMEESKPERKKWGDVIAPVLDVKEDATDGASFNDESIRGDETTKHRKQWGSVVLPNISGEEESVVGDGLVEVNDVATKVQVTDDEENNGTETDPLSKDAITSDVEQDTTNTRNTHTGDDMDGSSPSMESEETSQATRDDTVGELAADHPYRVSFDDKKGAILLDTTLLQTTKSLDVPLERILATCLNKPILDQYCHVNKATLHLFKSELRLSDHLMAIRKYLLCDCGDYADLLSSTLFQELHESTDLMNTFKLNSTLETAIRLTSAANDEMAENLEFSVRHGNGVDGKKSSVIQALDFMHLNYKVSWPLSIVVTSLAITKYNRIFNFLMRLRRVSMELREVWSLFQASDVKRKLRDGRLRVLQSFRHELQHFVDKLQGYIITQLLEVGWTDLQTRIDRAGDLEEMRAAHLDYLDMALASCLLTEKSSAVMEIITEIFNLILRFRDRLLSVPNVVNLSDAEYEHHAETQRQFKKYCRFLFIVVQKLSEKTDASRASFQGDHRVAAVLSYSDLLLRLNYNKFYHDRD